MVRCGRAASLETAWIGPLVCALIGILPEARDASAAGFALKHQSTDAAGTAFAGASASATAPSMMFFNPASVVRFDKVTLDTGLTVFDYQINPDNDRSTSVTGADLGADDDVGNAGGLRGFPYLAAAMPLTETLSAGITANVAFGNGTDYDDEWSGRYHATRSDLTSFTLNPVLGIKLTDKLALAAGPVLSHTDADLRNAVDFGTLGALQGIPGAVPGQNDGKVRAKADDFAFGFTAGLLYEPVEGTRLGVGYRSEVDHELTGRARFDLDGTGIGETIRANSGAFADSDIDAGLTLPQMVNLGVHHDLGEKWSIMAETQWTGWSSVDENRIEFQNDNQPDSVTRLEFDDAWFYALGAEYRHSSAWTFRGGVAFDDSPTRNQYRTPRIPDSDRYWITAGLTYRPHPGIDLDLALTQIFFDDTEVDLRADEPTNATRGSFEADYEGRITMITLGLKVRF